MTEISAENRNLSRAWSLPTESFDFAAAEPLHTCGRCAQPMDPGVACDYSTPWITDRYDGTSGDYCRDCNVGVGQRHHLGCALERCPDCGGQLISCEC